MWSSGSGALQTKPQGEMNPRQSACTYYYTYMYIHANVMENVRC